MKFSALILTVLLASSACSGKTGGSGGKTPPDESSADRTPDTSIVSLDAAASAEARPADAVSAAVMTEASVEGTWESASCGERHYPRSITVMKGGGFTMTDLVAPCPPGAKCVWSGIVYYGGTWKIEGAALKLTYSEPGEGKATLYAKPAEGLPVSFVPAAEGEKAGLVAQDGKDSGCIYSRQ
jgi:hypothetical protein